STAPCSPRSTGRAPPASPRSSTVWSARRASSSPPRRASWRRSKSPACWSRRKRWLRSTGRCSTRSPQQEPPACSAAGCACRHGARRGSRGRRAGACSEPDAHGKRRGSRARRGAMADAAAQPLNGRRAFVLGGGVAGIAAALALRARGFAVELLGALAWRGGRGFSRLDERLGSASDNGPHVMLGCYDAFRRLLRELGAEAHFVRAPALAVAYADGAGRRSALRLRPWPVPCAMPLALLGRRDLPLAARLRALWGMLGVLAGAGEGAALADWLRRWRQHGAPRDLLWQPLCLAVMNCEPEAASARVFLRTMRRAFTGSAARGAIWLPDAPWGEIVGEPARRVLAERGVRVRHGARVRALRVAGGRVAAVVGEGFAPIDVGERDVVVTTLPWQRLAACL